MRGYYCTAGHICGPVRTRPGGKVEKIVVAGGGPVVGGLHSDLVDVYDISTNTWEAGGYQLKGKIRRSEG